MRFANIFCYSPWGHKGSDTTDQLHFCQFVASLSDSFQSLFKKQTFMEVQLFFFKWIMLLISYQRNFCLIQVTKIFLIVYSFTFKTIIHFELIFLHTVKLSIDFYFLFIT